MPSLKICIFNKIFLKFYPKAIDILKKNAMDFSYSLFIINIINNIINIIYIMDFHFL